MGQESPYYKWFPKDFASDPHVIAMDNMQELIYRRLLDRSWELGGLPDDEGALARLAGVKKSTFRKAWTYPLTECWDSDDLGRFVNPRQEKERAEHTDRSEKARAAATLRHDRARKRLSINDRAHANAVLDACLPQPQSKPDPDPGSDLETDPPAAMGGVGGMDGTSAASPPPTRGSKKFWWDPEAHRIWGTAEARERIREKWLARGLSPEEYRAQLRQLDRWLEDRPGKRRAGANLANRINNWLNKYLSEQEERGARLVDESAVQHEPTPEELEEQERMARCRRDHSRLEHRKRSESGKLWFCVDDCGWYERVREEVER